MKNEILHEIIDLTIKHNLDYSHTYSEFSKRIYISVYDTSRNDYVCDDNGKDTFKPEELDRLLRAIKDQYERDD
jgi:hypothetical protein